MKVMDSCPGQGASRSDGCAPSLELQRCQGCDEGFSTFDTFGVRHDEHAAGRVGLGWHAVVVAQASFLQASGLGASKYMSQIRGLLP